MHRNQSVNLQHFAMSPRADIPRSKFRMETTHKSTFDGGYLVPIYVDEVLPGDTFNVSATMFARMSTPIFPVMDNLHLDTFFFFVPCRLLWDRWEQFMGEQANPGDSIDYIVPVLANSPNGGFPINTIFDYMGLPVAGQIAAGSPLTGINALPFRAYNLIWNDWFRDENLQTSVSATRSDGPDGTSAYNLLRRGKRGDYFTTCLPWVQKGTSVTLPLGTSAPVRTSTDLSIVTGVQAGLALRLQASGSFVANPATLGVSGASGPMSASGTAFTGTQGGVYPSNLYADLSTATAATINQLRQSFQIQKLLERDARSGTRYAEVLRAHFGVISPDARLQRPEYLGGSSAPININPIAQTQSTDVGVTPLATLAAFANGIVHTGFTQSFTEHGYIIGLIQARADLTYQQGLRKMWSRRTRYDFYFPVFAHLGEQAVLNKEIYTRGDANDDLVFGYQERWAEYRYHPSRISGLFRSTSAGTLDAWHAAQRFTSLPTLNSTFIQDTPPIDRIVATPAEPEFLFDSFFTIKAARPLPMYSVPGLVDHF